MKEVYLMLVSANMNSNKFYHMKENQDGTFQVNYGRVGVGSPRVATYPISNWNVKYNEKIRKGYQDMSDTMLVKVDKKKNDCIYKPISNKVIKNLVDRLQEYAKEKFVQNIVFLHIKLQILLLKKHRKR